MHIGSYVAKPDSVLCHNCQMTPITSVKHRDLLGHSDAHLCCGKSLVGTALVRFDVRQHARQASISKRAPSTTRPSLRSTRGASVCSLTTRRSSGINSLPEAGPLPKQTVIVTCD